MSFYSNNRTITYMLFFRPNLHFGQYHFPLGFATRFMQPKWNHSIGQSGLSQPIISPYDTCWQRQYVGSLGSTGMSKTSLGTGMRVAARAAIGVSLSLGVAVPFFFFFNSTIGVASLRRFIPDLETSNLADFFFPDFFASTSSTSSSVSVWLNFPPFPLISASNFAKSESNLLMCLSTNS